MQDARTGEWVEDAPGLADIDYGEFPMRVSTDRYVSREIAECEREQIWMRVWQAVARVDELSQVGDWKEYQLYDQSFVVVRGKDGQIRGFVNACRHRGNRLCTGGKGNVGSAGRFVCPYHLWSYDLDGRLRSILKPELFGPLDKSEHGLLQVPVECFAGFVFLNPDPEAAPLADFLGPAAELLAPYHLEEMVPVMNVREAVDCNWKVVNDAFSEGYHIDGIHPELMQIMSVDEEGERFGFFGDHFVVAVPFEVAGVEGFGPEKQVEGIRQLPNTFPGVAEVLPHFDALVEAYRNDEGELQLPDGVTPRTILQKATRETWTRKGLDVSGLTEAQMSDNHAWLLFPNFFVTIRAGDATVILTVPHPDGDPNRCIWHVMVFVWKPKEEREEARVDQLDVTEPGSYEYFLALQQDYEQMPRQQAGLRNRRLETMTLAQTEVRVAHFHRTLDRYLSAGAGDRAAQRQREGEPT